MAEEFPCPGRCNHAFREAELGGADHDVPFMPGQPLWCEACRTSIENDLGDLWGLALDLAPGKLNAPRAVNTGDSKRTKASSYPSGSPGWDAADDLIRWAIDLEDKTRERLGHSDARRFEEQGRRPIYGYDWHAPLMEPTWLIPTGRLVEAPRRLHDALRYLQAWTTAILSDFNGIDAGQTPRGERVGIQIRRHRSALVRLTGADRLSHRIKGECPRCHTRGRLAREDGTEVVKCHAADCGAMWSWDYFQLLAGAIVDAERVPRKAG